MSMFRVRAVVEFDVAVWPEPCVDEGVSVAKRNLEDAVEEIVALDVVSFGQHGMAAPGEMETVSYHSKVELV